MVKPTVGTNSAAEGLATPIPSPSSAEYLQYMQEQRDVRPPAARPKEADDAAFKEFLDTLGYPYVDETDNPVYRLFLRA